MIRAAAYARISDARGDTAGIERQQQDCRKLAAERGWTITQEYVDQDLSAFRGAPRPAFQAMLRAIREKQFDAIVVYHQDRLTRTPRELEEFLDVCLAAGVELFATVNGLSRLSHGGDTLLVARIQAAVAANQSDAAARRIRRKNDERAARGLPHATRSRPFGYQEDRVTIREDEAEVIRTLVARFIAGESLRSLLVWLNEENVRTVTGKTEWRSTTVRDILRSPRIAGLRVHRGEVVGPGIWPGIISEADHRLVLARFADPARAQTRSPRRYLLSGKIECGHCGRVMVSAPSKGRRRYACRAGADFDGCGKVYVAGESLDRLVSDAVLLRLGSPNFLASLSGETHRESEATRLAKEIAEDQHQLDELAAAYAERDITMREWLQARRAIESRRDKRQSRHRELTQSAALRSLVGTHETLAAAWVSSDMTLQRQAAILGHLVARVVVKPARRASNRLDVERVEIVWLDGQNVARDA